MLRQWVRAEPQAKGRQRPEDFLPLSLRTALPALEAELQALAVLRADHPSTDGSRRLLVGLADGRSVEAVLLPRGGLCVSSQVGCAVACVFCMTGLGGLERQLGSAEIVAQVALARSLRPVTKVVFMGMGEPAHNLDAVLEAIDLLGTGGGIGHKRLVLSTVGDLDAVAQSKQIALACQAEPGVSVNGDAGWLERLLLNLLDNALKFTPAGGRVTVSVLRQGNGAVLDVQDTGVGIAAAALPHIFERFYQADASRTRTAEGVGLGLSLVKWIALRHGATVDANSEPGRGSTFRITFP